MTSSNRGGPGTLLDLSILIRKTFAFHNYPTDPQMHGRAVKPVMPMFMERWPTELVPGGKLLMKGPHG